MKTTWFGGKLTANAAVYQIDWKGMQSLTSTPDGLYAYLYNSGDVRIRGGELELAARPIHGLSLTGSLAYTSAEKVANSPVASLVTVGADAQKGDKLSTSPDWTASASATYTWPLKDGLNGLVRADAAYTGEMSAYQPAYVYYTKWGSFTTVNLRAGVEGEGWGLYAFVNNLTDTVGIMSNMSGYGYDHQANGMTPRTVGVNAKRSF